MVSGTALDIYYKLILVTLLCSLYACTHIYKYAVSYMCTVMQPHDSRDIDDEGQCSSDTEHTKEARVEEPALFWP